MAAPAQAADNAPAAAYQVPRRRISYLIPPPPEDQPPPLLALPAPHEVKQARRGNPNPLIILASDLDPRLGSPHHAVGVAGSPSSSRNGASAVANVRRGSRQPGKSAQVHPEHTLGVSALALDTSTIIHSSGSTVHNKPAGILYSGGRDALVASWELSLPLKRRSSSANADRYPQHHEASQRHRGYRPRWAEDPYDSSSSSDEDADNGDAKSSSSRDSSSADNESSSNQPYNKSPRLRLDTTFHDTSVAGSPGRPANGLHLNLSASPRQNGRMGRRRSSNREAALPYEERWCIDSSIVKSEVGHLGHRPSAVLISSPCRTRREPPSAKRIALTQIGSTISCCAI